MWYLKSDNDDRVIYIISQAQPVIIGRSVDNQVCNFAIPDDPSISRKHASLTVTNSSLFLQDLGSRYGTFINDSTDKSEVNIDIQLKENDIVKFGKMNSVWKVNTVNLNTCTSTLKGENLQKLKLTLSKLGGVLKNEWDDSCRYLTMPAITLTIKVVLALVQGSYIVTPEFWSSLLDSVNNFSALPDPQKFIPAIVESTLNKEVVSFSPDVRRKSIFKDKKFIFFSRRQFEMYKPVLTKSGALPLLLGECKMSVSMLCEENVVVIQFATNTGTQETQAQRNQINDVITQLKNKGKRVTADAEIGLAILYCSTSKYCNPDFSFTSEVVKQNSSVVAKTTKILAFESQEPAAGMQHEKENMKINESYASDDKNNTDLSAENHSAKRKLNEFTSEVQVNANKKVATSSFVANIPKESTKRRLSGDTSPTNASKRMAIENDQASSNSSEDILNDKDNSGEMFNFINAVSNDSGSENKTKKLNLSRPQKRKVDVAREDGDLFNFVETDDDRENEGETSKQSIFSSNKIKKGDNANARHVNSVSTVTPKDISAMRGIKLKELMESNLNSASTVQEHSVKEEKSEDLEHKMSNLDLGNTVIIICSDLVVKKEPFINKSANDSMSVKNFKKFKKIWPLRKQQRSVSIGDSIDTNVYSVEF